MAVNDREIILDSLIEINVNNRFSHVVESAVLNKHDYLEPERKAFIKKVIEGTLEKQIAIDKIIDRYSKVKSSKLKPLILQLFRMSIYQIVYMDKVPDSAAINEAVKLANKRGFKTLSGFVNGVLRNISRNKDDFAAEKETVVPQWITDHLKASYGEEKTKLILEDILKEHPVTIRVRDGKWLSKVPEGLLERVEFEGQKDIFVLKKGTSVTSLEGFDEGAFVVQDIASMQPVLMAGIKKDDLVLDVCAAPGGKTIQAFDLGAVVVAGDISQHKVDIINQNIDRCVSSSKDRITARVWDATVPDDKYIGKADVVLADLPCSGLGVMGRKADIVHKTKPEDLISIIEIQKKILDVVWQYVKVGGVLMYSTCTMNPSENEKMSEYIVNNYPFRLDTERQFLPGVDPTDGFYLARLVRTE